MKVGDVVLVRSLTIDGRGPNGQRLSLTYTAKDALPGRDRGQFVMMLLGTADDGQADGLTSAKIEALAEFIADTFTGNQG